MEIGSAYKERIDRGICPRCGKHLYSCGQEKITSAQLSISFHCSDEDNCGLSGCKTYILSNPIYCIYEEPHKE